MNMKFADYIKDKRVVFVGASPIIQGDQSGAVINEFDVVVKTNTVIFSFM